MTSHLRECWYPVVRSDDLCEAPLSGSSLVRPYGIRLLGDPLVLFREVGGRVCALSDRCPHRSAPLSLGRLRDGRLECTYHGWQFDAQGACQRIPSLAPDSREHQRRTRQAAATSYPTHEQYGFVWVWPQPGAEVDSALLPHHLFTRTSSPEWIANHGMRDLEIDHGLMIENLLDPSHLPFTHENTLAKRSDAEDMSMDVVYDSLGEEGTDLSDECSQPTEKQPTIITEEIRAAAKRRVPGFSRLLQGHCKRASKPDSGYFSFIPPYTVVLDIPISPTRRMIQLQFCVPLTPHKMRLQFVFLRNFATQVRYLPGQNRLFQYFSDRIIDQDLELLAGQQLRLQQNANAWHSAVPADRLGQRYRRWRRHTETKSRAWFGGFNRPGLCSRAAGGSSVAASLGATCSADAIDVEDLGLMISTPQDQLVSAGDRFDASMRTSLIDWSSLRRRRTLVGFAVLFLIVWMFVVGI